MEPLAYRTRSLKVHAVQLTISSFGEIVRWLPDEKFAGGGTWKGGVHLLIFVAGGEAHQTAREGDWIVRDQWGEFSAYTADEFAAMYEEA